MRSNICQSRQPLVSELMLDGQVPAIEHRHLEWTEIVRHVKCLRRDRFRKYSIVRSRYRRRENGRELRLAEQRVAERARRRREQKLQGEGCFAHRPADAKRTKPATPLGATSNASWPRPTTWPASPPGSPRTSVSGRPALQRKQIGSGMPGSAPGSTMGSIPGGDPSRYRHWPKRSGS